MNTRRILFMFVFGGALAGSTDQYMQVFLPGILVQTGCSTPFTREWD